MLNLTNQELLTELQLRAQATGNIDMLAALAMVAETVPTQPLPAQPATTVGVATPAPQAAPASPTPSAPVAASAAVAGQPEAAPMLRVTLPPGSPYKVQQVGELVQALVSRFMRNELPPLATRLMQCAADVALLEQLKEQR